LKPRTKRAFWIVGGLAGIGVAASLVLNAFQSNLVFFFTPSQIASNEAPRDRAFRVGGLVESGSLQRDKDALTVRFKVTDTAQAIPVVFTGILPDLFKEGKGVVVQGRVGSDGVFRATEVLAKHDENYMPPEAAESLRKAGNPIDKSAFAGQKKGSPH
jgi:cytochrome c-type biogenesis protein CcmE